MSNPSANSQMKKQQIQKQTPKHKLLMQRQQLNRTLKI